MFPPACLQQNNWFPRLNIVAIPGPTLGMVFSESVKADKWARKHELSVYLGRYIVESTAEFRVESVLWQEDDRVILVEKAYYLAEKRWPANYA